MEKLIEIAVGLTERASGRGRAAKPREKDGGNGFVCTGNVPERARSYQCLHPILARRIVYRQDAEREEKESITHCLSRGPSHSIPPHHPPQKKRREGAKRWRVIQSPSSLQSLTA